MTKDKWLFKENQQASKLEQQQYFLVANSLEAKQASNLAQKDFALNFEPHSSLFAGQVCPSPAPKTLGQLLAYCQAIAGKTVAQVAQKHAVELIDNLQFNRGWLGNLIELALGAQAGSKPTQDFIELGVELKTLAITPTGGAKSDVFVSSLPTNSYMMQAWETSHVFYKLKKILFVPVESNPEVPLGQRRIGKAFFWSPNAQELEQMRQDWELIMQILTQHDYNALKSNVGKLLCVRVKALNSKQNVASKDLDGFNLNLPPLSFYLRRSFLNEILKTKNI